MRILFDANVVLDVLLRRPGLVQESAQLLNAVETHRMTGLVSATTITTIHYLVARHADATTARRSIEHILRLFEVAPVGRVVLEEALGLGFGDFEDAVQHEAARHAGAEGIVTHNTRDVARAALAVYAPAALLHLI